MNDTDKIDWQRRRFKRNKVWLALGPDGQPLMENGKVLIKYQLDQTHEYWVHPQNVLPLDAPHQPTKPAARKKATPAAAHRATGATLPSAGTPIEVYTDGAASGNPGPAGIGVVLSYAGHRKEISRPIGQATNNIAELEAIRTALEHISQPDRPVVLYTDSAYALGVLTLDWKPKKNRALIAAIRDAMTRFTNLRIVKVKGHAGHPENECADRLATDAAKASV